MQFFKHLFQSSQTLSSSDFEKMCQNAEILEQDERGIKVVRLPSGDILKVFRVKRLISGTNIYSYARRFCRNAIRLHKLAIPTVQIKTLYHFEDSHNTAVLYSPLAGKTIRQLIHENTINPNLAEKIGIFLANLHSNPRLAANPGPGGSSNRLNRTPVRTSPKIDRGTDIRQPRAINLDQMDKNSIFSLEFVAVSQELGKSGRVGLVRALTQ
ncbi:MAG: hypothetical protein K0U18_05030 [Betaproteobacteria bacterium]|nr:hypothetical protein [Betaproteobacteria bacterium]